VLNRTSFSVSLKNGGFRAAVFVLKMPMAKGNQKALIMRGFSYHLQS
jgi:hypothetical protein